MSWLTDDETRVFENHLHFRDNASTLEYRHSGLFPVGKQSPARIPPKSEGAIFPALVLELSDRGFDLETARRLAGESTMRLPDASFEQLVLMAMRIDSDRKAA